MIPASRTSADTHHRKRSFDVVNENPHLTALQRPRRHDHTASASSIDRLRFDSNKRRPPLLKYSMVGESDGRISKDIDELPMPDTIQSDTQILVTDAKPPSRTLQPPSQSLHHRDSVTSIATASTESSPTTTNSTFDSPLLSDPSPSSSPESATSLPSISPFRNIMASHSETQPSDRQQQNPKPTETSTGHSAESMAPVESPKNLKNLSLNINAVVLPRPATATGLETSHAFSAPTSPSKDTPRTGRRKPANLTIRTPGFQQLSFPRALDVPPTPSSRPSLHHMQSSPALAALASPAKPPPQGLFLRLPTNGDLHSGSGSDSSSSGHSANGTLPELKEEDEFRPQRSQETQEKGYPEGPVLIYDSGVYLYLEPTAEEASDFDTVINVAKEIRTPFEDIIVEPLVSEPQTAISELSFKSAWEWPRPGEAPTPTTPKPGDFNQKKQPEYLHIPWDHNSEILEDLYSLCRIIDERVQAGKKVLIHCQLGVSRSASLVIAYGLYKGYQPDFHSMYMSVKQRSQWVGPNMSLIYQLTDFRSKVVKGSYAEKLYSPPPAWWKVQASTSPSTETPIARKAMWQQPAPQRESSTAVSDLHKSESNSGKKNEMQPRLDKILPPVPLFPRDDQADTLATPVKLKGIFGGIAQQDTQREAQPSSTSTTELSSASRSVSPRPLPFRERFDMPSNIQPIAIPPRTAKLGILTSSPRMDLAMHDVPETPSLFSPRATEFMASPFGITSAGDLAAPSLKAKPSKGLLVPPPVTDTPSDSSADQIPTSIDPRSPHQQGEGPEILRNIDDFL
ncbi:tyrosine/serine/threonine protein phosphatase [Elasticomyces elasticus]|uniref:protein-tyrosine-phosphatase n=1 Tax=Exophiala sideris TaxID=1016849 RepID=A0ABR0J7Z2_9EURO|nr:tyrosine/serine/threonine protein phosphatase [Elasticomyces elasticus]KAK5058386.1 tyrosine/serine/threonine protein phosphatase [Exophiala sideris]